ncbi:preprotein translocase subunit SecE [Periweissella beninensis]|uniref:Protein translocase subunit SecE n=1 Tax=Periweissella beninensis TaxID=504936 RepID=A0ABT0VH00_9LACO|nr:preprotein translocase subunit SecE [Periweissella beninensis]MCM2436880.1 preprotein translocase subunit SecE [Periweissella beninensis]
MMKFLKSVFEEMRIVTWPTAKENRKDSLTVIGTSIFFAVFLGCIDWLLQYGINLLTK